MLRKIPLPTFLEHDASGLGSGIDLRPMGVMIVLIAWTRRYMLALRERRIFEQQLSQAG
jgi:hypothetical protein